jgi:hypothetical protein
MQYMGQEFGNQSPLCCNVIDSLNCQYWNFLRSLLCSYITYGAQKHIFEFIIKETCLSSLIISFTYLNLIKFEEGSCFLSKTHYIIYGFFLFSSWDFTARIFLFLSVDSGTVTPHTNKFTTMEAIFFSIQLPVRWFPHASVFTSD